MRSSAAIGETSYGYLLPAYKANHFFEGSRIFINDDTAPIGVQPAQEFRAYLSSRNQSFSLLPALWLTSHGTPPTRSWFLNRLRTVIMDTAIAGQSLRVGGATYFASIG